VGILAAPARPEHAAGLPRRPPGYHLLGAQGGGFAARDCVCDEGVRSPRFEGQYERLRIAVVLSGSFVARNDRGTVLLGPGALLLGNAGSAYEYRHVDDGGDRSIVFDYDEALLDEVGRSVGARLRARAAFERACVPPSPGSAAAAALAREALRGEEAGVLREAGLAVLAAALSGLPSGASAQHASPRQQRRVAQVMRRIEQHPADDCSLDSLAVMAGLSSFHFLRIFRSLTGQTPRQFVIAARLRAAAALLRTTRDPVIAIALKAGFGDLSHFHASFARWFGTSPRAYRRRRPAR
jgi:AraC family transcriptional regulator